MNFEVLALEAQRLGEHRVAHPAGRGTDRPPRPGHREDDRLSDLVKDQPAAGDIPEPAEPEGAELHPQQAADILEAAGALLDASPRIGWRRGKPPDDALCEGGRRVHLHGQEKPVLVEQTAEQIVAIRLIEIAGKWRSVQPCLAALR